MQTERRSTKFTERLSLFMVTVAALGACYVLMDPKITFAIGTATIEFGGEGFSADLKGAVVSLVLIGGWTAVKEFWFGSSASSERQSNTIQRIAESSDTLTTDKVDIAAAGSVNIEKGLTK